MDADQGELILHSFAEAYLYLLLTRCAGCGGGALGMDWTRVTQDPERETMAAIFACPACGRTGSFRFDTRHVDLELVQMSDFAAWRSPAASRSYRRSIRRTNPRA